MKHDLIPVCLTVLALCYPSALTLTCLYGNHLANVSDVTNVKQCSSNQYCSLEQYINPNGVVLYKAECKDKPSCGGSTVSGNNMVICSECCHTDLCSATGCHQTGYATNHGTICYHCDYAMHDPQQCDKIRICQTDEICSVRRIANGQYRSGCENKQVCGAKQSSGACFTCCTIDLCNNYCKASGVTPTTGSTQLTASSCVDNYPDCPNLGAFYCRDTYCSWSMQNCKKYCNWCNRTTCTVTQTPTPALDCHMWMLFMKGVAGATGPDLYKLWHSNSTFNPNQPLAPHLTTEFNGHYKPGYSNHWDDYCIDKVKVSILKNGAEKAYIIFDAQGADKMSWFTPYRILSSSYSDLQTAHKKRVSMRGDPANGMEFLVSGYSSATDPCNAFGWMLVSTKSSCNWENGDPKPSYYYAPGTTQAHWGFTNPGFGDVFAVHASPTCSPTQGTTKAAVCKYQGQTYTQGQTWQDRCQYNCSCEDAYLGYYRCTPLCPSYQQLPPDCRMVKVHGQCCPRLDCTISLGGSTQSSQTGRSDIIPFGLRYAPDV